MKILAVRVAPLLALVAVAGCVKAGGSGPEVPLAHEASDPPAPPAAEPIAEASAVTDVRDARTVPSRITEVTVYSDRAFVRREATVHLSSEPTVYAFSGLPSWVDEGSVRVASSRGSLVDVRATRRSPGGDDPRALEAEERHEALVREAEALDDELAILDAQKAHVESIQAFSVEKLSRKAVTTDFSVGRYEDVIDFISGSLRETAKARRAAVAQRARLAEEIERSDRALEELRESASVEEMVVLVALKGRENEPTHLSLSYATPGATWTPAHELRAGEGEGGAVVLDSYALVTQTTGEDWSSARLAFSTQSFSQSQTIPDLEMLALGDAPEVAPPSWAGSFAGSSFGVAQQRFAAENSRWTQSLAQVQGEAVRMFGGLAERGTTVHFAAARPVTVRADGQSVRVPIGTRSLTARPRIVSAAEESLNAAVTLEMTHRGTEPLLPGPVARFDGGAFLGETTLDLVAPGETFSVFFRVADHIKLSRTLDRAHSSIVRGARNVMQLSFVTTVENLSDEATTLDLAERIPVAQNPEIRVSQVRVTPARPADSTGIVRWTLSLAPHQRQALRVSYRVDYPATLALEPRSRAADPSAPAPARKRSLDESLADFESQL